MHFLLTFAQSNLDRMREGALLDLRGDVGAFLGERVRPQDLNLARLTALQQDAKYVLHQVALAARQLARGGDVTVEDFNLQPTKRPGGIEVYVECDPKSKKPVGVNLGISVHKGHFVFALRPGGTSLRQTAGPLRETFLFALGFTLSRLPVLYLRICPECSEESLTQLFFAEHGRQQFCSRAHANRAATYRFRAKHRAQERQRLRAHYEKKMRRNPVMKNAKIGRNKKEV